MSGARDRRAATLDAFARDWRERLGPTPPVKRTPPTDAPDEVPATIGDPEVIARRERFLVFPPLAECRRAFGATMGPHAAYLGWDESATSWTPPP